MRPSLDRDAWRRLIIQRHRLMLEAELRRLRMFPEDDEPSEPLHEVP